VRRLVKRFGGRVTAVDQLDLSVRRGETYGLLGPNGAEKPRIGQGHFFADT
jgi:ABC-2 type transport system ATP-binding protein